METAHEVFNLKQSARDKVFAYIGELEKNIKKYRLACLMSIEYAETEEQAEEAIQSMKEKIARAC